MAIAVGVLCLVCIYLLGCCYGYTVNALYKFTFKIFCLSNLRRVLIIHSYHSGCVNNVALYIVSFNILIRCLYHAIMVRDPVPQIRIDVIGYLTP